MAQGRAFVRYALLSCGFAWALCGCTGKVTGGEANAATEAPADAGAGVAMQATADAGSDRGAASQVDAGANGTDTAGAGGQAASGVDGGSKPEAARDAGAPREMEAAKPARAPDPATPTQAPAAPEGELTCEPLSMPAVVTYPTCASGVCPVQDSVCVPGSAVQALGIPFATATALPECSDGSKCIATAIVEQAGHVRLSQCTSIAGAEGRCVSSCMPVGSLHADQLPQGNCKDSERCAPCYDPRDGRATGVCGLGCDRGPAEPPRTLDTCCKGRGKCMPPQKTERASLELSRDSCDSDAVCMPTAIMDSRSIPKSCKSVDGAEGRCLSNCVGRVTSLPELPTKGCDSDEVCAPCYDPITGRDTGACNLHGDAPKEKAHRFERCCDSDREIPAGVCVPPSFTRVRQADLFRRRNACSRGTICVPTIELIDPDHQYPLCLGVGLGVCMPSCLFDPLDALLFNSLTCDRGEVCAPCSPLIGGCN